LTKQAGVDLAVFVIQTSFTLRKLSSDFILLTECQPPAYHC